MPAVSMSSRWPATTPMPQRIATAAPGVPRCHAAPTSGCPANGSSFAGVKIRTATASSPRRIVEEDRLRESEGGRHGLHHVVRQEPVVDPEMVAARAVSREHANDAHGDPARDVVHGDDGSEHRVGAA